MHGNVPFGVASAREIARRGASQCDDVVAPSKFGKVARIIWPIKTAAVLADIGKTTIRSAERWISGEHEPPASIVAALLMEILRRS